MTPSTRTTPSEPEFLKNQKTMPSTLRIGISQCLLGDEVRFDGGHKRDTFLTQTFTQFVEWVPVCPEFEAGLGVPREAMRLVGTADAPRLITIKTKKDHTSLLTNFARKRVQELDSVDLDGFVFKKDSPSCGVHRVRIYNDQGMPHPVGRGLFAERFMNRNPLVPVEEEGRLNDPVLRENFVERVFGYHRWQQLTHRKKLSRGALVDFHTKNKYLLLAHSRPHYQQLGRLVADGKAYTASQLREGYGRLFMEALRVKATVHKHVNVLDHMAGHLKTHLGGAERAELSEVIQDYHHQLVPLTVPMTLIKHYARRFMVSYLLNQTYLNPHPKELMLRNHV